MNRRAIVVGAGPAGALLAYILASRGVAVTLIERHADFAREFRGEGLSPGGQLMFRQAGLWDAFEALPQTAFERAELFYKARRFAAFDLDAARVLPRWVAQPAMLEMLVEKASAFPSFTFRRGVRVTDLLHGEGRVSGVELTGPEGQERLEADYLFACDGRFSVLRKAAGLDHPRNPEFFDIVWCKLPMPSFYAGKKPTVRGYIGSGHLGLFIPSYDGLLQIGWVIRKGSYKDFRDKGIEHWLEQMAGHVTPDMADHLRAHRQDTVHPFLLDVVCDCYERWSVPGLTLVGDAAHPMSPVGGQGINIALRDAVIAANHFVPGLLAGAAPDELDKAAQAFQAERMEEVVPIQALQRRGPRVLLSEGLWPDLLFGLLRCFSAIGVLGWLGRRSTLGPRAFLRGVTEVDLKV